MDGARRITASVGEDRSDQRRGEELLLRRRGQGPTTGPHRMPTSWRRSTGSAKGSWEFRGHQLQLTNLNKVLFPADASGPAITKRDLIRHYVAVAPAIMPYLADRPVNLHRFPDGIAKSGFWQKALPGHAPEWLIRWHYDDARPGETQEYLVIDSPAALAWAANNGAVELHPWTSSTAHPHQPTWAMIDIDPGDSSDLDDVLVLARLHRTALDHLGVTAMPKLTGQRGVQIWVPVAIGYAFDDTRAWVERLSRFVGDTVPDMVSWEWGVAKRGASSWTTRRTRSTRRWLLRSAPARPPGRRCRSPSRGTSWTTRTCARVGGRSATLASVWPPWATRSHH